MFGEVLNTTFSLKTQISRYIVQPFINAFEEKETFYFAKRRKLPDKCFFPCFSFQARRSLALFKFYNAAIRRFLKTFTKFAGTRP